MIRGKNGEPKPRVLVDFSFTHAYYYTSVSSATMKTDKDGIIHLGHLKNITTVISFNFQPFSFRYQLLASRAD